ncbi:hypothetical protein [Lachnoclostridium sp.]|uniref:hypothetical protein n=1 Tax=Lachnoclostridium sp. TaxID=2028282 RepID=UPI002897BDB2|nr:hypothetical protein [Lachnoclostridium sp.]
MNSLATEKYTHEEVKSMLLGNRKISFKYELIDKNNNYLGLVSAQGSISYDTRMSLMRTGSFIINEISDINSIDERLKIHFNLHLENEVITFPLGVLLISSPARAHNGRSISKKCDLYDQSVIVREDKFDVRHCVKTGNTYTGAVENILTSAGIISYDIAPSDKVLLSDVEFEIGTSKLDAINSLLISINYSKLHFNEIGIATALPYKLPVLRDIEDTYETDHNSIIKTGVEQGLDVFNVPNKIVRYLENPDRGLLISNYENNDPTSILSIPNRGRKIVDIASVSDIADQASLDALVYKLASNSVAYETLRFKTGLMPHHGHEACLQIKNKDIDVQAKYIEEAWSMDLSPGGDMIHYCKKVVPI